MKNTNVVSQDALNAKYARSGKHGSGLYLCNRCDKTFSFLSVDAIERVVCPFCMSVDTRPVDPVPLTQEVYERLKEG